MNHKILLTTFLSVCAMQLADAQTIHAVTVLPNGDYSPDTLIIKKGDKVSFQVGSSDILRQVNKSSWEDNEPGTQGFGFECTSNCTQTFAQIGDIYYMNINNTINKGYIKVVESLPLGITEYGISSKGFNLYPNPVLSDLTIKLKQEEFIQYIQVVDAMGKEVSSLKVNAAVDQYNLDLSGYEAGLYQVILHLRSGKLSSKVVIK